MRCQLLKKLGAAQLFASMPAPEKLVKVVHAPLLAPEKLLLPLGREEKSKQVNFFIPILWVQLQEEVMPHAAVLQAKLGLLMT